MSLRTPCEILCSPENRVPGDNFYRYEATVSENPIITKALTSCVAYGLGDLTAQIFLVRKVELSILCLYCIE